VNRVEWEKHAASEAGFWETAIAQNGQGWVRFNRNIPINRNFRPFLDLPVDPAQSAQLKFLNILVVGSGPSSDIGYADFPDAKVNLVLTDPLAPAYESLFQKHNAYPPQKIMPVAAEQLQCFFQQDMFHLVYSVNALDHSYDPAESLRQMVHVAAPCSWVVVELWENEAKTEKGWGMHQWNFYMDTTSNRVMLEKYRSNTPIDLNAEMAKVGAQMSAIRFNGCYLNDDSCRGNNPHAAIRFNNPRLRMKIRKLGAAGQQCPVSTVAL